MHLLLAVTCVCNTVKQWLTCASIRPSCACTVQAPTDGQVSQETALAQQITKGQAREIMQKYMPVPEAALQTHCSSLVAVAMKHKQMHMQVCFLQCKHCHALVVPKLT